MYKKIIHSIQEEHFDHPALAEQAIKGGNVRPISGNIKHSSDLDLVIWPIDGNCDPYSGNVMVPMAQPAWHYYRDLDLHGNLLVTGNVTVTGYVNGVGTTSSVAQLSQSPASSTWPGRRGELAVDTTHMYLCVEDNKWIRWPISKSW